MGQNGVVGSMSFTRHLISTGCYECSHPIITLSSSSPKINNFLFFPDRSFPLFISEALDQIRLSIMGFAFLFLSTLIMQA
ncbi:hypothetical protein OIU84_002683 [Salix udensis]|uniref:Uncharacterized protein n=1 Tax=Salix udensis TaxID=889485 RepID=A0AAD6P4V9_9ROSI|nr:hypothetical protein OIU84_002683 [Salix udensis]